MDSLASGTQWGEQSRVSYPIHAITVPHRSMTFSFHPSQEMNKYTSKQRWIRIQSVLVLAALLAPLQLLPARAKDTCEGATNTAAETRCLMKALELRDRELEKAMRQVAQEVAGIPDETFQTLWRDNLTNFYKTSTDPVQQVEAFRSERRKVCAFAKSVGFQGTGYGISTTRCELALTQTLLAELKP